MNYYYSVSAGLTVLVRASSLAAAQDLIEQALAEREILDEVLAEDIYRIDERDAYTIIDPTDF